MGNTADSRRGTSPSKTEGIYHQGGSTGSGQEDDQQDASSQSDGPTRKRRRSRKGLDKKFMCPTAGCGKSYSRAEHLYRHQLNHNSKQIYRCEYPDCPRTFVRGDLLKRHMDRHAAKGSQLGRRDSLALRAGFVNDSTQACADNTRLGSATSLAHAAHLQYQHAEGPTGSRYAPASQAIPGVYANSGHFQSYRQDSTRNFHSSLQRQPEVNPYGNSSSTSNQREYHDHRNSHAESIPAVTQDHVLPFNIKYARHPVFPNLSTLKDTNSSRGMLPSVEYSETAYPPSNQTSEVGEIDQIVVPGAGPAFRSDDNLNKSSCVGMPEDFMAYLFKDLPGSRPSTGEFLRQSNSSYSDLQSRQYSIPYVRPDSSAMGHHSTAGPQQVMAVNNLLDQDVPEAQLSDEKSQEIFDFIRERFNEDEPERQESIFDGDRSHGNHLLSKRMMQAYIKAYWLNFSDQLPILHKPTFTPDKSSKLLLLAMMTLGATSLDRTFGQKVTAAGAKLATFLAWHLRWNVFMDTAFRAPAKLWIFQTLILLELYEKMYSTRELHERAHIHHATTITLMRRGRSLIGKSSLDPTPSPLQDVEESRHSYFGDTAYTADEWWNHWITNEATRRAAFAAFCIDSIHATMFGHSGVMVAHEMRLPLPCEESLWEATSSAEVGRVEAHLLARDIKPILFLEGLKRTLSHQEVPTTPFGRTVLMAGLLSVTYHMHQRDLQVNVLGGGVIQALGGRDKWRATLTRAYDFWRADFDKAPELKDPSLIPHRYPYRINNTRNELKTIFDGGTVLHHLAHMSMHADIVDCQIFARAKRLLGRSIGPQEFNSAQHRIKDYWASSARARDATFYALSFLKSVLAPEGQGEIFRERVTPSHDKLYEARDDIVLNRPWVMYFSVLVVWCYGFALEGPCSQTVQPQTEQEQRDQMRAYLLQYGSLSDPNELRSMRGLNNNTALLMVLKDAFAGSQWELLHEGANLLRNCIILNLGSSIV